MVNHSQEVAVVAVVEAVVVVIVSGVVVQVVAVLVSKRNVLRHAIFRLNSKRDMTVTRLGEVFPAP